MVDKMSNHIFAAKLQQFFDMCKFICNFTAFLVKTPFDTQTRIAHKSLAGKVITELYLRADMEVRALEPLSDAVPQLRFGDEYE